MAKKVLEVTGNLGSGHFWASDIKYMFTRGIVLATCTQSPDVREKIES